METTTTEGKTPSQQLFEQLRRVCSDVNRQRVWLGRDTVVKLEVEVTDEAAKLQARLVQMTALRSGYEIEIRQGDGGVAAIMKACHGACAEVNKLRQQLGRPGDVPVSVHKNLPAFVLLGRLDRLEFVRRELKRELQNRVRRLKWLENLAGLCARVNQLLVDVGESAGYAKVTPGVDEQSPDKAISERIGELTVWEQDLRGKLQRRLQAKRGRAA